MTFLETKLTIKLLIFVFIILSVLRFWLYTFISNSIISHNYQNDNNTITINTILSSRLFSCECRFLKSIQVSPQKRTFVPDYERKRGMLFDCMYACTFPWHALEPKFFVSGVNRFVVVKRMTLGKSNHKKKYTQLGVFFQINHS